MFVGALGCILSSIVINVVILKIIYNFIVNRKSSFSKIWIIVISSILVFGISLGMAMIGFTKFDNVSGANGENIKVEKVEYAFDEKMYFRVYGDVEYIESDNDDVKVEVYSATSNVFTGYLTPYIYNQAYAHVYDTIQLEAVSKLSVIKEIDYTTVGDKPDIVSFKDKFYKNNDYYLFKKIFRKNITRYGNKISVLFLVFA